MKRWIKRTISGLAAALMLAAPITGTPVLPAVQTQLAEAATTKSKYTLNKTSLKLYWYPDDRLRLDYDDGIFTEYTIPTDPSYPSSYTLKLSGVGNKKVTWKSSNKRVATVSSKGKVTIQNSGTATITATCGSIKRTCKVTGQGYVEAEDIYIESKNRVCNLGSYIYLAASVDECATNRKLTFSSSNPKIAKVNKYGKVTGLKEGTATITISAASGIKRQCKVTVKKDLAPSIETFGISVNRDDRAGGGLGGTEIDLYAIVDENGKILEGYKDESDDLYLGIFPWVENICYDICTYSNTEWYWDEAFGTHNQFPDMNAKIRNFEVTSSSPLLKVGQDEDGQTIVTVSDKAQNAEETVTLTVKSNYDGTKRDIQVHIHYMTESEYSLQAGYAFAEQLNVYRKAMGLEEVKYLDKAQPASDLRAQQITEYFSHVLPEGTGGGPFVQTGIIPKNPYISDYYGLASGEVIAVNGAACVWTDPPEYVAEVFLKQWKYSAPHWAILTGKSQRYVTFGIAWNGGTYAQAYTYWNTSPAMKYVLGEMTEEEWVADCYRTWLIIHPQ